MLHQEEVQTLVKLGLTSLQAKVYFALISLENPTANATAKLSKVARQEVYRITDELAEVGIVSRVVTTPTEFQPLPLSEAVSFLLERRIKETVELQAKACEMMKNAKDRQTSKEKHYEIKEFPENGPWFEYVHRQFKTFKTFDLLTSSKRFAARMIYDEELYRGGLKRGTKIRILTEKPRYNASIFRSINSLSRYPDFKVKYVPTPPDIVMIILDQKEAALALAPLNPVGPPYLVSNHPSFLHMTQQYFETIWNKARDYTLPKG